MLKAKPNQVLHAVYGAQGDEFCDAENILFYNVGPGFFTHVAGRGVRFERAYSYPDPSQALLANHLHYHRYATVDANDTFSHWQPDRVLAKWSDVQLPRTASATTASSVWYHMKSGLVDICQLPSEELKLFGLCVIVKAPANDAINISGVMKPLLDGLIAAFHAHNGEKIEQISQRLGATLHTDQSAVVKLLNDQSGAILGRRRLLGPFRKGIMWNPADDLCLAAELLVERHDGNGRLISGSLFEIDRKRGN